MIFRGSLVQTRLVHACLVAVLLATLPRAWAQRLPDLGDSSAVEMPPQLERRIGESIMRDIRLREPTYLDDPEIAEYLNGLGARLGAAAPGVRHDFEFFAMRDPAINAFALPGGFIGVNTGLVSAAENESEVAAVLAHEMAHVTQRHLARLMGAQKRTEIPVMIATVAAILLGRSRPDLAAGAAQAAQGAAIQQQLGYSRDFEREADRIGFQTLSGAGFEVRAMGTFFEKMQRQTRHMDDGSVPSYLRTHPVTTERIADAQSRAASARYRQHADPLDFHLVRAKVRAESGDARDAVTSFANALADRRFVSEAGTRYGLALALARAREPQRAEAELAKLRASGAASPMIEALAARLRAEQGDKAGALALLKAALARFPQRRSILYAELDLLHQLGQHADVLARVTEPLRHYPRDARLHEARAKAYGGQGKRLLQHQAQAEVYVLRGSLPAAVEQLQLAQGAGDGNFYELSAVDARLKELRAEHQRELEEKKKSGLPAQPR
jgi:predicted Zn-dependent protease